VGLTDNAKNYGISRDFTAGRHTPGLSGRGPVDGVREGFRDLGIAQGRANELGQRPA
jgi:hypothetical protein